MRDRSTRFTKEEGDAVCFDLRRESLALYIKVITRKMRGLGLQHKKYTCVSHAHARAGGYVNGAC